MKTKYKYPSLGYPGGKSKIAKKIIAKMPPHKVYVEPFAGASHVFFKKPKAEKNVLNDKNKELIRFFQIVKNKKFCCKIEDNENKHLRINSKKLKSPCDYIYLNKTSYSSKSFSGKPAYSYDHRYDRRNAEGRTICIDGFKLNHVILQSQDFRSAIKQNDSRDTLFYIDPPYVKANEKSCLYGKGFCSVTPEHVAQAVRKIKGKALISYDDHPEVRKAFRGFKFEHIVLPYSLAKDKDGKVKGKTKELLIRNYHR